jgi:Na+-transporting NADH:ubiquinone oxidoreductase subunit C
MSRNKDSLQSTIIVASALCLVCSIVVSTAAVALKDRQKANKLNERNRNVLSAAGMYKPGEQTVKDVQTLFEQFEVKLVDLETGNYLSAADMDTLGIDIATYDQRKASKIDELSIKIPNKEDIAVIKRRAKYAAVYVLEQAGEVKSIVLPVKGYGLWSVLYGFLAIEADGNTVSGLTFYEHAETPGLGGEVDNPKWKALWPGKQIVDDNGEVALTVVKGKVIGESDYEIDGLSGATLTSKGVANLIEYWMGDKAFGSYLAKLRSGEV